MRIVFILYVVLLVSCERSEHAEGIVQEQVLQIQDSHPSSSKLDDGFNLEEVEEVLLESPEIVSFGDFDEMINRVRMLGEEGKIEAIPFLIENLTKIHTLTVDGAFNYAQVYPCSDALVRLGNVATPEIVSCILSDVSEHDRIVLLYSLVEIEGKQSVEKWLDEWEAANLIPEDQFEFMSSWVALYDSD